jgi:alanine dehydrogenase
MPGAAPLTSTFALCAATAPYVEILAARGLGALADDPGLAAGLNVQAGVVTHPAVARSLHG